MRSNQTGMHDVTTTIFAILKANANETTKEVARPKAALPLSWWRPKAATFVLSLNSVNVEAVTTMLVLRVGVIRHHVPRHYAFIFPRQSGNARLRESGVGGALPPRRAVWGVFAPQLSKGVWGRDN